MTGHAVARDATTETHAPRIFFTGTSGDIRAEGGVRSTDFSPNGNAVQLAQVPANITSDTMQGNSKAGRAVYNGHARLWQGDSVLEADSMELLRETKCCMQLEKDVPSSPRRRPRRKLAVSYPARRHLLKKRLFYGM